MKTQSACILACVTPQESCSRLIAAGARVSAETGLPLKVICVLKKEMCMEQKTGGILEMLSEKSQKYDADLNVYFNDNASLTVAVAAKKHNASTLIMGFPREGSSGFISQIHELLPKVSITMVDENSNEYKIIPFNPKDLEAVRPSIH